MTAETAPTRERILASARRLFAQRGYNGTSVGDIEAAAGLSPRSGALYKHFASKRRAARGGHGASTPTSVDEQRDRLELMPLGDTRAELTLMARWGLAELRREHELTRIVMKEGDRFPEIADRLPRGDRRARPAAGARDRRRLRRARGRPRRRPRGRGLVHVASLVGHTLQETLFGPAPRWTTTASSPPGSRRGWPS